LQRIRIFYSGRVQGVGFRYTAVDLALKLKINGWVRNLPDDRVEILAQADENDLEIYQQQIMQAMSSYITEQSSNVEPIGDELAGFKILY
jgi:acylphosphatase